MHCRAVQNPLNFATLRYRRDRSKSERGKRRRNICITRGRKRIVSCQKARNERSAKAVARAGRVDRANLMGWHQPPLVGSRDITPFTPELERETHDILSRAVDDLKERTFQVTRIDPLRAPDGSVVYYDITVHP